MDGIFSFVGLNLKEMAENSLYGDWFTWILCLA